MKIFIATPIAGFNTQEQMLEYRKSLKPFFLTIRQFHTAYAEIEKFSDANYDSPEFSVKHDFALIKDSDVFIMHYPQRLATSALIELGYAIALCKRIIIIVENIQVLPFLAQGLDVAYDNVTILQNKILDKDCAQRIIDLI